MSGFTCPICGTSLTQKQNSLCCEQGHCYDIAKKGYVNLLLSQQPKNRQHGDDRQMVAARRAFLESGAYDPLRQKISEILCRYLPQNAAILDAGCGECYYTAFFLQALAGRGIQMYGVDISREALQYAGVRRAGIALAVASVFHLPMADNSCDAVLNIFSPLAKEEYLRVLRPGGMLVRVTPLARHLWQLKAAVYDSPYENSAECFDPTGFEPLDAEEIHFMLQLQDTQQIKDLFYMTPYAQKTAKSDMEKLDALHSLACQADFAVQCFRKL